MLRQCLYRRFTSVICSQRKCATSKRTVTHREFSRSFNSIATRHADVVPLRKQLKDAKKQGRGNSKEVRDGQHVEDCKKDDRLKEWELTVGIEIHAQLNTTCKLFSGTGGFQIASALIPDTL